MISVMIVAAITVHLRNGFFVTANGIEVPLLYIGFALLFAFGGYGIYSLDDSLGLAWLSTPHNARVFVLAAVVVGLLMVTVRRPSAPTPPAP
jgi:hypothetical protein